MENLFILIPFGLYGLFKFTKWWIKMTWQKKTDIYNTDDDCFSILPTIVSMLWTVTTVMYLSSEIPKEIMFNYILFTFFGPFTIILGLIRLFGFGNTKIGKFLGCFPPTKTI